MTSRQPADYVRFPNWRSERKMKLTAGVQLILIGIWVYLLRDTDSYYSVYLLCAVAGAVCVFQNACNPVKNNMKKSGMFLLYSVWFASATVLANYRLFIVKPLLERAACAVCALLGGTVTGYQVIRILAVRIPFSVQKMDRKLSSEKFFALSFCLTESIFLLYLFGAAYPAYFTPDVFSAINQIIEGVYINHNPFWYTMSIKLIAGMGYSIFGNANGAIAFYIFVQGMCMAAVCSYVLVTFYQIGVPKWVIWVFWAVYTLLPYNLALTATMLKDIPFSIACLLFAVSLYRIIRNVGRNRYLNYLFFCIGAFVFCLMRTNGLASFFVTMLVVLPLLPKSQRRVLVTLVVVLLVAAWVLTNPVLEKWNVGSSDFVETLAVPFQQVARVITMGYELTPDEYTLLNRIFDVKMIPDIFMHECVDPIKMTALRGEGRTYLREETVTYVKLWLQMGRKYPGEYLKAWIELTKGYWNGGYAFAPYFLGGQNAAIGIVRPDTLPLRDFFEGCFEFVERLGILQPFYSIGLQVWLLFGCWVLNIKQKRTELVLAIPGIIIILGLWLGTPLYAEFRYAYPIILSMPLVIGTTIYHKN